MEKALQDPHTVFLPSTARLEEETKMGNKPEKKVQHCFLHGEMKSTTL